MQTTQCHSTPQLNMAGACIAAVDDEAKVVETVVNFGKVKARQLLTAQAWELLASAYSADILCEQKGDEPVSVRYTQHGGYLYTTMACTYGGLLSTCTTNSYRLIPLAMYMGKTYQSHTELRDEYDVSR